MEKYPWEGDHNRTSWSESLATAGVLALAVYVLFSFSIGVWYQIYYVLTHVDITFR